MRPVATRASISKLGHFRPMTRLPEMLFRSAPYLISDRIIALTNFEKRTLIASGLEPKKVVVIPHGVRRSPLKTGLREKLGIGDKMLVLTVARFVKQKGHAYLIQAIPRITKRHDVHFLMIGSQTTNLRELVALSKQLGVESHVTFMASASSDDVAAAYHESDVFVLPSLYESFGIAALEAMAAGMPVLATRVGGVPEIVEDMRTGILVRPADPAALAERIEALLGNSELRSELGNAAREVASDRYQWKEIAERTQNVYEELLKH